MTFLPSFSRRSHTERFISSVVFALTIPTATASFAQSPLPAQSNKAVPASIASDTVDVQHVIDAYHEAVLTPRRISTGESIYSPRKYVAQCAFR
jgi:hypothetical protein